MNQVSSDKPASGRRRSAASPAAPRRSPAAVLLAVAMLLGAVLSGWQSCTVLGADWQSATARVQLSKWVREEEDWSDEEWEKVRQELLLAAQRTPEDVLLYDSLAQLHSMMGLAIWTTGLPGSPGVEQFREALRYNTMSIERRPLNGEAWAGRALIHYSISSPAEEIFAAWRRAYELGPQEPQVVSTLKQVGELAWERAPEDVRDRLEEWEPGFGQRVLAERKAEELRAAAAAASAAASAASAQGGQTTAATTTGR